MFSILTESASALPVIPDEAYRMTSIFDLNRSGIKRHHIPALVTSTEEQEKHAMNPNTPVRHRIALPFIAVAVAFILLRGAAAQEVTVSMVNRMTVPVDVILVDKNGVKTPFAPLPPGATRDQGALPGQVWQFMVNGKLVYRYQAVNAPAQQVMVGAIAATVPTQSPDPATAPSSTVEDDRLRTPIDFRAPDLNAIQQAILEETNRERAENRLPPLRPSPQLTAAAQTHASDMVTQNFFSHTNPYDASKRSMAQRIQLSGFKATQSAENIATAFGIQYVANTPVYTNGPGVFRATAAGPQIPPHTPQSFAAAVVKQWMNSPVHRRSILSRHTFLGVGAAFYPDATFNGMMTAKVVQVFGTH